MIIAIDFDGTCVTHEFPEVGIDINSELVLRELIANGHRLILFTMRSGKYLVDAVNWFKNKDIPLWGIQTNPEQHEWTTSPKAYAHLYIDDAALGCPLTYNKSISNRPFVDWIAVRKMLIDKRIIKK
jgi:hypothetical protein